MEKNLQKAKLWVTNIEIAVDPTVKGILAAMSSLVAAYGRMAAAAIKKMVAKVTGLRVPRDVSAMEALHHESVLETLRILREKVSSFEADDLTLAAALLRGAHENWHDRFIANIVYASRAATRLLYDKYKEHMWQTLQNAVTMLQGEGGFSPLLYADIFLAAYRRSVEGRNHPIPCPSCELFNTVEAGMASLAEEEQFELPLPTEEQLSPEETLIERILLGVSSQVRGKKCSPTCDFDPAAYETTRELLGRGVVSPLYKIETQAIETMVALAKSANNGALSKAHKKALVEVIVSVGQTRTSPSLNEWGATPLLNEDCNLVEEAKKLLDLYIELSFKGSSKAAKKHLAAMVEKGVRRASWRREEYGDAYPKSAEKTPFGILAFAAAEGLPLANLVKYFGDGKYEEAERRWPGISKVFRDLGNVILSPVFYTGYEDEREEDERNAAATLLRYSVNEVLTWCEDFIVPPGKGERVPSPLSDSGDFVASEDGRLRLVKLADEDPRVLFAGLLTDCCQYPGGDGEESAWHAWKAQDGAIWAVLNKDGAIVAQSWAWIKDRVLVLDNVEALGGYIDDRRIAEMYISAADRLVHEGIVDMVAVGIKYGDCDFTKLGEKEIIQLPEWITPPAPYTDADEGVWILASNGRQEKKQRYELLQKYEKLRSAFAQLDLPVEIFLIYGRVEQGRVVCHTDSTVFSTCSMVEHLREVERKAYPPHMLQLENTSTPAGVLGYAQYNIGHQAAVHDCIVVCGGVAGNGWYAILSQHELVDMASASKKVDLKALAAVAKVIEVYCEGEVRVDLRASTSYQLLRAYMRRPGSRLSFIEEERWDWDGDEMVGGRILIES